MTERVIDLDDTEQLAEGMMLGAIDPAEATSTQLIALAGAHIDVLGRLRGLADKCQADQLEVEANTAAMQREMTTLRRVLQGMRGAIRDNRIHEPVCWRGEPPTAEVVGLALATVELLTAGDIELTYTLLASALATACLRSDVPVEAYDQATRRILQARIRLVARTGEPPSPEPIAP